MRNPARNALYSLLLVLTSAGLIWFGAVNRERVGEHWTGIGPFVLGFALLPFPLVFLVQALFAMRGQARLLAGIGVVARWQVDPIEWGRFRGLDSRRSSEDFSIGNDLWIRRAAPFGPVEVIVGERSALIDGSYHSLRPGGLPELRGVSWLEGPPACLEFALRYPRGRYGGTVSMTLRIPVPANARAQALRVFDHFERITRRTPGAALRNPPKTYRVWALPVLLAAAAGGIGYAVVRNLPPEAGQFLMRGLVVGASVLAVFGGGIALAAYLSAPPR